MGRKESFVQSLTEVSSTAKEKLGTIRDEGEKIYKYIQYSVGTGSIAGTAGRMAVYRQTGADFIVTCDVSDGDGVVAGQLTATMTDLQFGWIQIQGLSSSLQTNVVSGAAGNAMTASSTTDGTLKVAGAVTDFVCGVLVDATGGANRVFLNCPK